MPLRLHGVWDSWGIVFDPIPFNCTDGNRKVRCWAQLDALAKISGTPSLHMMDDVALAELFARWVDRFAELASDKFDRGLRQPDGSVCVMLADVPAPTRAADPPSPLKAIGGGR